MKTALWDPANIRTALIAVLVGGAFYSGAHLGHALSTPPDNIATFWPPNTIILAALLLTDRRHWWIYFLAMTPAYLTAALGAGYSVQRTLIFFIANCTEILIAAFALKLIIGNHLKFNRFREMVLFLFWAVLIAPFTSAFIASMVTFREPAVNYWLAWRVWFLGDALGHLTLTPVIVLWLSSGLVFVKEVSLSRLLELSGLGICLIAVGLFSLGPEIGASGNFPALLYAPLPVLLWAAIRFGPRGICTAVFVITLLAIWNAINGRGPFTANNPADNVLSLQLFLIAVSIPTMLLGSLLSEHRRAEEELHDIQTDLEKRVEERTVELKLKVEESEKLERELHMEKKFLKAVLDNIEDGIVACNSEGVLSMFNKATCVFHGLPQEELSAEQWGHDYDLYLADGKTPMHKECIPLFRAFNGENIKDVEMVINPKQGRKRVLLASGQPLFDSQHNKLGAVVSMHDITDRKQAEETLCKTHEQLLHAEKLSAIGRLSASIAHEFNNPLQGVLNIIKGIRRRVALDQEDTELIDMAVSECIRMRNLIKSLQDFNRPTSARKLPIDLHATLDSLLLLGKKEFKMKKMIIEKRYAENMPPIKVVPDQIKQVFLNIMTNASDACNDGGSITIETEVLGENVVARIHDTGSGIQLEDKDHIFEPFFTTKAEIKGTGLGLSVSYGIVQSHGGEITMNSEPDKGTTFSVTLPIEGE